MAGISDFCYPSFLKSIHLSLSFPPQPPFIFERRANSKRQSMELVGGVTLLLDFNLCKKVHQKKKEVVSKLSNVSDDGRRNDIKTLEDLTDAADGRACSSASADSIAAAQVAQNRRPSTVTVLQTWTCPCQGKIIVFFFLSSFIRVAINQRRALLYILRISMNFACPFFFLSLITGCRLCHFEK